MVFRRFIKRALIPCSLEGLALPGAAFESKQSITSSSKLTNSMGPNGKPILSRLGCGLVAKRLLESSVFASVWAEHCLMYAFSLLSFAICSGARDLDGRWARWNCPLRPGSGLRNPYSTKLGRPRQESKVQTHAKHLLPNASDMQNTSQRNGKWPEARLQSVYGFSLSLCGLP